MPRQIGILVFTKRGNARRKTSTASTIEELAQEQLAHFSIDPDSEVGQSMAKLAMNIYQVISQLAQHLHWRRSAIDKPLGGLVQFYDATHHAFAVCKQVIVSQPTCRITAGHDNPCRIRA